MNKNIVSTLTIQLTQSEFDLLEKIKEAQGQKVATKAIKSLLLYPERYDRLAEDNRKLKKDNTELHNLLNSKDLEIEKIRNNIQTIFSSFEFLRNI